MDPQEIIVVSPYAHHAGHHWANATELASSLAAQGSPVEVVIPGGTAEAVAVDTLPFPVHACSPRLAGAGSGAIARFVRGLGLGSRHIIEMLACVFKVLRMRGDIVHFIDATHLFLFLFVLVTRKRVFYTVLGYPDFTAPEGKSAPGRIKALLTRRLMKGAVATGRFAMICETASVQEAWRPFCGAGIHLIPYAIRLPEHRLTREAARERLGLSPSPLILLMFGTHRPEKDYEVVFKAAELLPPESVLLLFVGPVISGNDPERLARLHPGVSTKIVSEFVTDEEAAVYFAASDAVVLPYESGFNRGSGVLLLACQHERPVIATNTGHLRQFVEQYGTGFLFPAGDAAGFAGEVKRLVQMPPADRDALHSRICAAATEFSWDRVVLQYLEIYRKMPRD